MSESSLPQRSLRRPLVLAAAVVVILVAGGLALRAARRLVDHDLAVGKGKSFSLGPGSKKERAHARRHSYADGRDVTLHELHRVVYRHAGRYRSAGAVDIK